MPTNHAFFKADKENQNPPQKLQTLSNQYYKGVQSSKQRESSQSSTRTLSKTGSQTDLNEKKHHFIANKLVMPQSTKAKRKAHSQVIQFKVQSESLSDPEAESVCTLRLCKSNRVAAERRSSPGKTASFLKDKLSFNEMSPNLRKTRKHTDPDIVADIG